MQNNGIDTIENIYMIVAIDKDSAIGYKNNLLCYIPEDLRYFKNTTLNNTIVVGANTYFTFPKRPLPKRKNIILTKTRKEEIEKELKNNQDIKDNIIIYSSIEEVLNYAKENKNEKIFICGGESIYKEFFKYASKLYITHIDKKFEADTYFPTFDLNEWIIEEEILPKEKEKSNFNYIFKVYKKIYTFKNK